MLPGIFAIGMVSVLSYHFAGRGYPLEALIIWFIAVAINFAILLPLLAGHASVNMAALATSVACVFTLVLHMRLFAAESGGYHSLVPRPAGDARIMRGRHSTPLKGVRKVPSAGAGLG